MLYRQFHPEDVKAAIRKRFGSLAKFEQEHGLAINGVSDMLRGRTSARTAQVVDAVLLIESASIAPRPSFIPDSKSEPRRAQRQNVKAA